jgi:hypothetical protein
MIYYFIPVYGYILMIFRPYETDNALFALGWIFWHLIVTVPLPFGIFILLNYFQL